jgi:competence ComEA-like helix-hairpin-helix protein
MKAPSEGKRDPPAGVYLWAELLLAIAILLVTGVRLLPNAPPPAPESGAPLAADIDVNESPWYELIYLPGVGGVRARDIVEIREASGPFGTLEELTRVRGIGPVTVSRIRAYLAGASNGDSGR